MLVCVTFEQLEVISVGIFFKKSTHGEPSAIVSSESLILQNCLVPPQPSPSFSSSWGFECFAETLAIN